MKWWGVNHRTPVFSYMSSPILSISFSPVPQSEGTANKASASFVRFKQMEDGRVYMFCFY